MAGMGMIQAPPRKKQLPGNRTEKADDGETTRVRAIFDW